MNAIPGVRVKVPIGLFRWVFSPAIGHYTHPGEGVRHFAQARP
jgi:hypothetical protein